MNMKKILFVLATLASLLALTGAAEARGRYGSFRVGGYTSHGKGSHYVGGYVRHTPIHYKFRFR